MSSRYFLDIDSSDGQLARYEAIAASLGVASANKIPRTGADGKLDLSFIPDVTGGSPEIITAEGDIAAYSFVQIRYNAGRKARTALAADNTRPAMGFCVDGALNGENATIYVGGILELDPAGLAAANTGQLLFLSAANAGKAVLTPPSASSNIVQVVARIIEVDTVARIQVNIMPQYVRIIPSS